MVITNSKQQQNSQPGYPGNLQIAQQKANNYRVKSNDNNSYCTSYIQYC
ncbi:hypothetical protein SynROS8604_02252 [Synechococcus sp. ROS8604]|nr:hypothetical protein SynROS8604_02252 [Synechococcus sp. ROS8604]